MKDDNDLGKTLDMILHFIILRIDMKQYKQKFYCVKDGPLRYIRR